MRRWQAFGAATQALILGIVVVLLGQRWLPLMVLGGAAAIGQAALSLWILRGRATGLVQRIACGLSLAFAVLILGLYLQAWLHIRATFTEVGAARASQALATLLLAAPYLLAIPTGQALALRLKVKHVATGGLILLVLPSLLQGSVSSSPATTVQQQQQLVQAAWSAWSTGQPIPAMDLPTETALITPVFAGELGTSKRAEVEALHTALPSQPPTAGSALLVEFAAPHRTGLAPAGQTALPGVDFSHSAIGLLRDQNWRSRALAPGWSVPALRLPPSDDGVAQPTVSVDVWLVDAASATPLKEGWAPGPTLDAETALASAIAGGDYLLNNQADNGRFHYVVYGPSGAVSKGYNYPRHAGTAWFLARLAARTGLERFQIGATRAIGYLAKRSELIDAERAYVLDPKRRDGNAWVGTTALAALAANRMGDTTWSRRWGNQVAASVAENGQVRGNYDIAAGHFPAQPTITYGQGQALLALAVLTAEGADALIPALERARRYTEGAYRAEPGSRLYTLDEHWTCIAWDALNQTGAATTGADVCTAYLENERMRLPTTTLTLSPATASAGGLAEALASAAHSDLRGGGAGRWWLKAATSYAQQFLSSQYQGVDRLLLPRPDRLMGGYRNRPWDLDVQIDTVQHIGCALLSIEALLTGQDLPGSWT
jgi:hypothetical protein